MQNNFAIRNCKMGESVCEIHTATENHAQTEFFFFQSVGAKSSSYCRCHRRIANRITAILNVVSPMRKQWSRKLQSHIENDKMRKESQKIICSRCEDIDVEWKPRAHKRKIMDIGIGIEAIRRQSNREGRRKRRGNEQKDKPKYPTLCSVM